MPLPLVVYVDVDDTLVRHAGTKRIPIPSTIAHVRLLATAGAEMWCWSTGGKDYARSMAEDLGIADCFVGFLPKPNVLIDDQSVSEWRQCVEVRPGALGTGINDYGERIGRPATND